MALENDLAMARMCAQEARHNRDRDNVVYWTERAEDYQWRLNLRDNPWDDLKGSPEHG